jgi:hypothetical protein
MLCSLPYKRKQNGYTKIIMLVTTTNSAYGKAEPKSFRRFLLNAVLPLSLLLIAGLAMQWLTSIAAVQSTSSVMTKTGNFDTVRHLRDADRKAALEVIERLEAEARANDGVPSIASTELKRLRNALL